jgi:hypothetical protein
MFNLMSLFASPSNGTKWLKNVSSKTIDEAEKSAMMPRGPK